MVPLKRVSGGELGTLTMVSGFLIGPPDGDEHIDGIKLKLLVPAMIIAPPLVVPPSLICTTTLGFGGSTHNTTNEKYPSLPTVLL